VLLVASAFILSFYSVSATRGGIVHSVRWFPMSTMTAFFTAFIVIAIVATVYLAKRGAEVAKPEAVPETVTDSASVRRANRYGLFAVGVGAILIIGALAAQAFSGEHTVTLRPGDSRSVTDPFGREFTFISQGLSRYDVLNRHVIALTLDLQKEGSRVGVLTAERRQHVDGRGAPAFEPSTESGIRTGLAQDIVVFPSGLSQDGTAELRIRFNPFVALLWIGIAIAAIGWVVAMGSMTPYPVANAR